jgi:hypothetical protein
VATAQTILEGTMTLALDIAALVVLIVVIAWPIRD